MLSGNGSKTSKAAADRIDMDMQAFGCHVLHEVTYQHAALLSAFSAI